MTTTIDTTNEQEEGALFPTFEDFQHQNWITYRWASEFMKMLWYSDMKEFESVILKATKTISNLWIDVFENIIKQEVDGNIDYKLTRYACYIIAINWDSKKPEVSLAQNYFAEQTRKFEILQEDPERLSIRSEFSAWYKALNAVASQRWVTDYVKFNQMWNLWLYRMENFKLAWRRWISKDKLFDSMWRTELAANLFRVTQTEERIKTRNVSWQKNLENTHFEVWSEVRDFVVKNTWIYPEDLPQEMPLPEMKKWLKGAQKELKKKDKR